MPIIRGQHHFDSHFTQIPNAYLRDSRLSYKARGLLAELMSHTPGFEVSRERLAANGADGDRAIRSAIAELEAVGYLERQQSRDDLNRFGAAIWVTKDPESLANTPSVRFAPAGNAPARNAGLKNTNEKNTKKPYVQDELERQFEEFWKLYPRRQGRGGALKAFAKVLETVKVADVIAGAERFASDPNLPQKQFIPMPATWLNQERWLDGPLPERVLTPEEKEAKLQAEREARWARDKEARALERERIEREREEAEKARASIRRCIHDRVIHVCPVCSSH